MKPKHRAIKRSLLRDPDSHKADYGHALILAGSEGMTGAAYLATQAALLAGAGRVTLGTPKGVTPVLAKRLTEAMTLPLPQTGGSLSVSGLSKILRFAAKAQAAAIGPGLSVHPSTRRLVRALVSRMPCPLVIDADGLNALAGEPDMLRRAARPPVLTPHDGEFARLAGRRPPKALLVRKGVAKKFAADYDCILVLKGHRTVVSEPGGKIYVNRTGNPGMATGGTGDILTGMIAAFLAQGFDPFFAACLGVWVHGKAGDEAAAAKGQTSLIATDLLLRLPSVLKKIEKKKDLRKVLRIPRA